MHFGGWECRIPPGSISKRWRRHLDGGVTCDSAASIASQILRQAGKDLNRVIYGEQATPLYQDWPFAWLSTADTLGPGTATVAALAVAELGRSEALRDLMGRIKTNARIPPLGLGAITLGKQLVEALPKGTSTLSYDVTADTLLAWLTIPEGHVRVYRWAVPFDSLRAMVSDLRSSLGAEDDLTAARFRGVPPPLSPSSSNGMRFKAVTARLARAVVPPDIAALLPSGADLVVVPQNILTLIPFAVLPVNDSEVLGQRFALRYAPSLIALIQVEVGEAKARSTGEKRRALVVSDPTMPVAELADGVRMRLSRLPAADSEGAWVAARLGGRLLTGSQATESAVISAMRDVNIVHFATHALAYAYYNQVRNSFLALGPDTAYDGLLTVREIMDDSALAVPGELVVLSGCQTALGSVTQAEGTLGLQRAFLARGALLMKGFYDHWLGDTDKPTKAESLRRAERDLRATPRFANPLYWAAFELVGAN